MFVAVKRVLVLISPASNLHRSSMANYLKFLHLLFVKHFFSFNLFSPICAIYSQLYFLICHKNSSLKISTDAHVSLNLEKNMESILVDNVRKSKRIL